MAIPGLLSNNGVSFLSLPWQALKKNMDAINAKVEEFCD